MHRILKILVLLFISIVFSLNTFANDDTNLMDNSAVFNNGFTGQKQISDTKFKKTVEKIKERSLSKKQKKIREQVKPNEPAMDEEHLKNFAQSQEENGKFSQALTVMIPVKAYDESGKSIYPGYYKLSCRKIADNSYVLDLSQGAERILSVNAIQTTQDLEQETIQFCSAQVISNDRIRLIYGDIDLNLVAYLYYD